MLLGQVGFEVSGSGLAWPSNLWVGGSLFVVLVELELIAPVPGCVGLQLWSKPGNCPQSGICLVGAL